MTIKTSSISTSCLPSPSFRGGGEICPACRGTRVIARNIARNTCAIVGAAAGAASGAAAVLRNTQTKSEAGTTFGGLSLGGASSAVMGALFSGALGCEVGSRIGKSLDQEALSNYRCLDCARVFMKE